MRPKNDLLHTKRGEYDYILTAVTVLLVLFGIVMVYAASSYNAAVNYNNRYFYMFKQIVGAVLGFAALFVFGLLDYRILQKWRYVILGVSVLLLVLVFVPGVGVESYGARRWINLPFFTMQEIGRAHV